MHYNKRSIKRKRQLLTVSFKEKGNREYKNMKLKVIYESLLKKGKNNTTLMGIL